MEDTIVRVRDENDTAVQVRVSDSAPTTVRIIVTGEGPRGVQGPAGEGGGGTEGALLIEQNLHDLSNTATARTNLGLGSAATTNSTAYDVAGAATASTAAERVLREASDSAEATARTNADTAEATTRGNADTAETAARKAADKVVEEQVTTEAAARTAADALLVPLNQKAAINGVATLDGAGLIPSAQLPPLALTEPFVVASEAEQIALVAQVGDFAFRTDISKTYIRLNTNHKSMEDWRELLMPQSVTSVNGKAGPNVNLTYADVGADKAGLAEAERLVEKGRAETAEKAAETAAITAATAKVKTEEEARKAEVKVEKERAEAAEKALGEKNRINLRPYALNGALAAGVLAGWYVDIPAGKTRKIVGAKFDIAAGTSVKFTLLKNGVAIEGYKEITVEKVAASVAVAVALANGDKLSAELLTLVAEPKVLSLTFFEEEVG